MTPLQVILLGKRLREAQKRWPMHPKHGSIEVMELEKQFDAAIEPYVDYAANMETADETNR